MTFRDHALFLHEGDFMDRLRVLRFSPPTLHGIFSRRTAIFAVMALLIFQGVGIFYKAVALQLVRMRPAPAMEIGNPAPAAAVREPADLYRVIPERNLFGTTTKAVVEKQSPLPQQRELPVQFDVKGTVAGERQYGLAVIEERGSKQQRLVKVGDLISGAKVVRIKRNAMDILVGGVERTVKMAETKEAPILPPERGRVASTASAAPPPSSDNVVLSLDQLQDTMRDMGSMLSQARIRPNFNAGAPDGFILTGIRPGSLYQKMGIFNGDIIQEVNNRKIQTADDLSGLLNLLKSGSDISLTVKRGGSLKTMSYQFR